MRNVIIVVLVVAVLGLGGWIIYDNTRSNSSNFTSSNTSSGPNGANVLDLSNKGLTKVGPDIYNQTDVTTLILSSNNLKTLPSEMGRMTKLEVLKLDHNQLQGSLIAEIRKMPLRLLDVSYNNMTGIPAEIGQLHALQTLNYSNNKITGLPNELANLKNNLLEFNLTNNPLSQNTITSLKASLPHTTIIF